VLSEDPSARFAFGLRLLVDGIAAHSPSRVLSYKDIREAHHILEAAEAAEAGSRCGISPD
jgi:hypothetical protein